MFDIKYDKDGYVTSKSPEPIIEQSAIAPVVSEPEQIIEEPVQIDNSTIELAQDVESSDVEPVVEHVQETSRDRNTRALRELKEQAEKQRVRAEKERDEAIQRARDLEERYAKPSQKVDNNDEDLSIGEDDLVEGKHVKKIQQYVKKLENKLNQYEQRSTNQTLQDRIRYDYPDFNKVVTPENIELLKHLKPRQAQLLDSSTDMYATAASAYEMIKEYGIYQEPLKQSVINDRQLAQKNIAKPKPVNSISPQRGDSPLSKAHDFSNGFTQSDKDRIYKEMMEIRRVN